MSRESTDTVTLDEWLQTGLEQGYCSRPVCNTHDGLPATEEEDERWEDGDDPCVFAVRIYID
jgi:hypothetical protein